MIDKTNQLRSQQLSGNETRLLPRLTQAGLLALAVLAYAACGSTTPPAAPSQTPMPVPLTEKTEPAIPLAPAAFTASCSKCHGAAAEGADKGKGKKGPTLVGLINRPEEPRTVQDIIGIINNPTEYGLDKDMPAFADKLNANEKKEIAEWVANLR